MTALFLVVVMLLSFVSLTAVADMVYEEPSESGPPEEEYTCSLMENGEMYFKYSCGKTPVYKIPEPIEGYPVTKVTFGLAYSTEITKEIHLPKTVREIIGHINSGNRGLEAIVVDEEKSLFQFGGRGAL